MKLTFQFFVKPDLGQIISENAKFRVVLQGQEKVFLRSKEDFINHVQDAIASHIVEIADLTTFNGDYLKIDEKKQDRHKMRRSNLNKRF